MHASQIEADGRQVLGIGKVHARSTFTHVYARDPRYVAWVLSEPRTGRLGTFATWWQQKKRKQKKRSSAPPAPAARADEHYREQMREVYGDGLENLYGDDADAWRLAKEIAPRNAEAQARIVRDAKRHREEESDALFGRRTRKRTKYGDSDDSDNYD